jgi:GNAT superfamily N-acetyltransferase
MPASGSGELYAIYVLPEAWRRGVGRAWHGAAAHVLHGRGCREARLWVLRDNPRAREFYLSMGWTRDGAEKLHSFGSSELPIVRYRRLIKRQHAGRDDPEA